MGEKLDKIKAFFKKVWNAIKSFFKKLWLALHKLLEYADEIVERWEVIEAMLFLVEDMLPPTGYKLEYDPDGSVRGIAIPGYNDKIKIVETRVFDILRDTRFVALKEIAKEIGYKYEGFDESQRNKLAAGVAIALVVKIVNRSLTVEQVRSFINRFTT